MTRVTGGTFQGFQQGGGNNGGGGNKPRGHFMPGQINGIANDLQMGYGGKDQKWRNYLRDVYTPVPNKPMGFDFSGGGHGGGHNNGGGKPNDPVKDPNDPNVFDPSHPRNNRAMPMAMPMNQMGMQRPMQMQAPQMGLLNAPMQQPQQMGLLGDIPPEVLAYITRR